VGRRVLWRAGADGPDLRGLQPGQGGFDGPVMLASALVGMREQDCIKLASPGNDIKSTYEDGKE
jgi:hypothetical protein